MCMCAHVCAYIHAYLCIWVHTCAHGSGDQRIVPGMVPQEPSTFFVNNIFIDSLGMPCDVFGPYSDSPIHSQIHRHAPMPSPHFVSSSIKTLRPIELICVSQMYSGMECMPWSLVHIPMVTLLKITDCGTLCLFSAGIINTHAMASLLWFLCGCWGLNSGPASSFPTKQPHHSLFLYL